MYLNCCFASEHAYFARTSGRNENRQGQTDKNVVGRFLISVTNWKTEISKIWIHFKLHVQHEAGSVSHDCNVPGHLVHWCHGLWHHKWHKKASTRIKHCSVRSNVTLCLTLDVLRKLHVPINYSLLLLKLFITGSKFVGEKIYIDCPISVKLKIINLFYRIVYLNLFKEKKRQQNEELVFYINLIGHLFYRNVYI